MFEANQGNTEKQQQRGDLLSYVAKHKIKL